MGKGDFPVVRVAHNVAMPKGSFATAAQRGALLVTKNISKGLNYQDAVYLYSRLGEDQFAVLLVLQLFGFPTSEYAGCNAGVLAVGMYTAIHCTDDENKRWMTTVAANEPILLTKPTCGEWFEVQIRSNMQLMHEQQASILSKM